MDTTYLAYNFYANDLPATLDRIKTSSAASREISYYRETIGTITTIDEFLDDDRIYAYALKAYGLEEMSYAKAFIRKVLESDLTDIDSFANRLQDTRYRAIASAYDFGQTNSAEDVQTSEQTDNLIDTYDQNLAKTDDNLRQETSYYKAVADSISNVDDLFKISRARDYVFRAYNIDPQTFNYETIRSVITSDVNDPNSYVNTVYPDKIAQWQVQRDAANAQRNDFSQPPSEREKAQYLFGQYTKQIETAEGYFELAEAFNFKADGTLDPNVAAQSEDQLEEITERFVFQQPRLTTTGALMNREYYEENIGNVSNVDDLLLDLRMRDVVKRALGLPELTSYPDLRSALTQDPEDPTSPLYRMGNAYIELHKTFNFNSEGNLDTGEVAQSPDQQFEMLSNYVIRFDDVYEEEEAAEADRFRNFIGLTQDLDDLLSNVGAAVFVREYALKANGIDPDEVSIFKIRQVLTSDPYDPDSYVNSLKDDRFVNFAKSFNFTEDGEIGPPRYAQTETEITRISRAYFAEQTRFDSEESTREMAEAEVSYYRNRLQTLENVDELISDKRLTDVLLISEGLDPDDIDAETLRRILVSDLGDPDSYANIENDIRYKKLAGSFNFNENGVIESRLDQGAQNDRGLEETNDLYLKQLLEEEAGAESVGARLALYFQRVAPTVNNVYDILADSALAEFIRTSFSIPPETAGSNIDNQAELFERHFDIQDLRDPEQLEQMTRRFLALYDLNQSSSEPILDLFSGNTSFNYETLITLSQLRNS